MLLKSCQLVAKHSVLHSTQYDETRPNENPIKIKYVSFCQISMPVLIEVSSTKTIKCIVL
jgi:hypothetical protein